MLHPNYRLRHLFRSDCRQSVPGGKRLLRLLTWCLLHAIIRLDLKDFTLSRVFFYAQVRFVAVVFPRCPVWSLDMREWVWLFTTELLGANSVDSVRLRAFCCYFYAQFLFYFFLLLSLKLGCLLFCLSLSLISDRVEDWFLHLSALLTKCDILLTRILCLLACNGHHALSYSGCPRPGHRSKRGILDI